MEREREILLSCSTLDYYISFMDFDRDCACDNNTHRFMIFTHSFYLFIIYNNSHLHITSLHFDNKCKRRRRREKELYYHSINTFYYLKHIFFLQLIFRLLFRRIFDTGEEQQNISRTICADNEYGIVSPLGTSNLFFFFCTDFFCVLHSAVFLCAASLCSFLWKPISGSYLLYTCIIFGVFRWINTAIK